MSPRFRFSIAGKKADVTRNALRRLVAIMSSNAATLVLANGAMVKAQRVGIGTVVMRTKQYLAAIRPLDTALVMSTMRFADEIVDASEYDGIPTGKAATAPAAQLKLAGQIIESMASEWDPTRYHDTYTDELRELIEAKANGEEITAEAPEHETTGEVVDLLEALKASVEAHRKRTPAKKTRSSSARSASNAGFHSHAGSTPAKPR